MQQSHQFSTVTTVRFGYYYFSPTGLRTLD